MLLYQVIQNENFIPKEIDVNKQTAVVDIKKGESYVSKELDLNTLPLTIANTGIILNQEYILKDISHLAQYLDKALDYLDIASLDQVIPSVQYTVINYNLQKQYTFKVNNTSMDLLLLNEILTKFEENKIGKNDIVHTIVNVYDKSSEYFDLDTFGNEIDLNLIEEDLINMVELMTFQKAMQGTYYVEYIPSDHVLYLYENNELNLKNDVVYLNKDNNPIKWVTNTLSDRFFNLYEIEGIPFNTRGFRTYIENYELKTDAIDVTGEVIKTGDFYNSFIYTLLLRPRDNHYI